MCVCVCVCGISTMCVCVSVCVCVTGALTVFGRDRFNNPSPGHAIEVYIEPQNRIPTDLRINDLGTGRQTIASHLDQKFTTDEGRKVCDAFVFFFLKKNSGECAVTYKSPHAYII